MKAWVPNSYPTVGVEQEYHLIDPQTADLVPEMERVWRSLEGPVKQTVSHELFLSILETSSEVARGVDELLTLVVRSRRCLARSARRQGVLLAAAGTHPFARPHRQKVVPSDHYRWVHKEHGIISRRMLALGLHVHVGLRNAEAGIYIMHEMKRWAYPLLALSANSPFFEGRPSGLASTRALLFHCLPRTLLPPAFKRFADLERFYERLLEAGEITRPGDLWWMIRIQPPLGTVEYRIFDLPTDVRRVAALTAICQAASAYYQDRFEHGCPMTEFFDGCLEQNRWQATRYGLEGRMIDPVTQEVLPVREQLARLLEIVAPKAAELGSIHWLGFARRMMKAGSESQWQLRQYERLGRDLRKLELLIAQRTAKVHKPLPAPVRS